jgi:hypothetical protein
MRYSHADFETEYTFIIVYRTATFGDHGWNSLGLTEPAADVAGMQRPHIQPTSAGASVTSVSTRARRRGERLVTNLQ